MKRRPKPKTIGAFYGFHGSAAIHQVKELVPVEQIHSELLDSLPAAKRKCPIVLWPLNKGLPKEIVGHALERTPFTDCLLLDPFQQVIINCQRRSGHASKCTNGYIKMSKASWQTRQPEGWGVESNVLGQTRGGRAVIDGISVAR